MASLSQVTLELKVTGERQATKALKDFADAGNKVGTSVGELGRKLSSIEGEYKRINDLNKQGVITDDARRGAISKLVVQLRQLTGITGDQARAALEGAQAAKDKSEADKRAAQAAEQHARAQKNLEGSILRQAQAVNQAVRRMDELKRLQASGAVGSRDMAQAELEVARALARTNGYLKANGALNTQKALAELRAAQATRESAAAEAAANAERQRAQQGYNRLMASINPVIARQQDMRRAHETVMAALKAEIITRDQAAQALREYRTAQQSSNMASSVAATQYIPQVRRQTNQLGVVFQQAGYQVGDFAVQVQSGTNVMVALGQQLTQLVGVGAMLARSTKWIAAFSALGIIVPITTAIVGGFMRANGEAKKFKDTLDELETSVSSYKSSMEEASASTTELNARFGDVSDSMRPFLQDLVELERITAVNRLQQSFENLEVSQQGFMDTIRSGLLGSAEAVRQIRERLDLTSQEYVDFYEKLRVLQEAESFGDRAAAAKELSEFIKDTAGSVENMTPDMREFYQQLVQAVLAGGELNGVIDRGNESLRERATIESTIANIQREVNSGVQQILDFKEQETQQLQNQLALQLIANEYGEDSAEYARLKRQQEEEAYRTYLSQNDILGNNADEIIRTWRALQNANDAANDVTESAETLEDTLARIAGMDMPITGKILQLAQALNIATNQASQMLNQFAVPSSAPGAGIGPSDPGLVNQTGTTNPLAITRAFSLPDITAGGGGGGGGGTPEWMSRILSPEMQRAIEEAAELTKQYEQEVKLLDSALENGLITQQEYNSYVAQAQEAYGQAADGASEFEKALSDITNMAAGELGDALLSIIDGTSSVSDAFRDMARTILSEMAKLAIINPLINSIFGSSGLNIPGFNSLPTLFGAVEANGGVWNQGAKVQAFATGGVVSGPTTFPMANGQVGLMGEAGPEAIMPLKRGKGGRLGVEVSGEQGNVTINQTFAFSANGDDSVKKIIAQEAPKIAALTQKQMLDARRRGGVVRDTFA